MADAFKVLEDLPQVQIFCMRKGSQAAYQFLKDYHSKMDWRGPHWIPGGTRSGEFARKVVEGWQQPVISGLSAVIDNNFGLLNWKVTGGTISPKNVKYLTIPLIPAAKGIGVRNFGGKLFVAGKALCQKIGDKLEAAYALATSVTQKPWPGALPQTQDVHDAFEQAIEPVLSRYAELGK